MKMGAAMLILGIITALIGFFFFPLIIIGIIIAVCGGIRLVIKK